MTNPAITLHPGQMIVFEGDSLTAQRRGTHEDTWPWLRISGNDRSWADVMSELLFAWRPELGLDFRTSAVGGSTVRDVAARYEERVAPLKPAWVFLTLGGNDANHAVPLGEYRETLRGYAGKLAAWGGQLVIVTGLRPMPNADESTKTSYEQRAPYYAAHLELAAEEESIIALDVGAGMAAKAEALYDQWPGHNVYNDGRHFSHLGAMILAGEVLQACGVVTPSG